MLKSFPGCEGFDWDAGNRDKNWLKHRVRCGECEQIFFNQPCIILDDRNHSVEEKRMAAFGRTDQGRLLTVVFAIRDRSLRVISARDMSRKERKFYEAASQ